MENVLEGRTYYRDKEGNEITQAEYERLQFGETAGAPEPETEGKKPKGGRIKNEGGN